jgi:signal transduction histidine kinase
LKCFIAEEVNARCREIAMGFAIVKAVVQAHHDAVGVTSQVEKGSVFFFTLPLSQDGSG